MKTQFPRIILLFKEQMEFLQAEIARYEMLIDNLKKDNRGLVMNQYNIESHSLTLEELNDALDEYQSALEKLVKPEYEPGFEMIFNPGKNDDYQAVITSNKHNLLSQNEIDELLNLD